MKLIAQLAAATALVSLAHAADEPKPFAGLLTKDTPVRGEIGTVEPPPEVVKYMTRVEQAARKDIVWYREYTKANSGAGLLPYHEKIGLTKEEYDDYVKLWAKREFKALQPVVLQLREAASGWTISASGAAGVLTTLRYDAKNDVFKSPNGELKRIADRKPEAQSILGSWEGKEWLFEEETALGKTRETIAIGKYTDKAYGLIIYRAQEVSTQGTPLLDKGLVVRIPLGAKAPTAPSTDKAAPAKPAPAKKK